MPGKAERVLLAARLFAGPSPELALNPDELLQQRRPARLVDLGQEVFDSRQGAVLPFPLEADGGRVDPGPVGLGDFSHGNLS